VLQASTCSPSRHQYNSVFLIHQAPQINIGGRGRKEMEALFWLSKLEKEPVCIRFTMSLEYID